MEKNIQTWNQQAAEGGYHYRLDPVEKAVDDHLNDLLQKIFPYEEFKGKKVLDVGCGTGDFSLILILYASEVVGIDLAEASIILAKTKMPLGNIKFIVSSAYEMPFPDDSFDIVVCRNMLHHLDEPEKAIKECSRLAKTIVIIESNGINPYRQIMKRVSKVYKERGEGAILVSQLKKMLNNNGFRVQRQKYGTFIPPAAPRWSLGFLTWIEKIVEKTPLIKFFGGTYIAIAQKRHCLQFVQSHMSLYLYNML